MNLSMFGVSAFGFIVQVISRVVYGVFGGNCVSVGDGGLLGFFGCILGIFGGFFKGL